MKPEDRHYLVQMANILLGCQRFHNGIPLKHERVGDYLEEPEEDVYIRISHMAALDMAMRLAYISADDRSEEHGRESSADADEVRTDGGDVDPEGEGAGV
jgi:hypothetical protein